MSVLLFFGGSSPPRPVAGWYGAVVEEPTFGAEVAVGNTYAISNAVPPFHALEPDPVLYAAVVGVGNAVALSVDPGHPVADVSASSNPTAEVLEWPS